MIVCCLYASMTFALSESEQCKFNGINYAKAQAFTSKLKSALKNDDSKAVSKLISYPLRVNINPSGKINYYLVKNKSEFLKKYHTIFTDDLKKAVIDEKEIFCNYQGAMLVHGFIWFQTYYDGDKIFVINTF